MQKISSGRPILISLALAVVAAMLSLVVWNAQLVVSFQDAVLIPRNYSTKELATIPFWVATLLIAGISLVSAFEMERLGARRALPSLVLGLLVCACLSLTASWFLAVDILFTPLLIATTASVVVVQIYRLYRKDLKLTEQLLQAAKQLSTFEVADAHSRLLSGLRLLDTVLSPTEAILFRRDHNGRLSPAARLRSSSSGALDVTRHSIWRDGLTLCEQAIRANTIVTQQNETSSQVINLALPLTHETHTVGALLIRLSSDFDESDRNLLKAVGAQMARNLQREQAFNSGARVGKFSFFSAHAAEQRFESLYVLNGLIAEQRFGVGALEEISEGLAIAYLDGTVAYTNANLIKFAKLADDETRTIDLLALLEKFRTDVFDDPTIAVRRVLQTGEPYEREIEFPEKGATYRLRISLIKNDEPLCLAVQVTDLTRSKEHDQLKSDMISLMSHEIRTPLTSINGFAELLTADEQLPPQAKEFVTIIANESQRLSKMINTFLAVTQLQRKDKQEVSKIPLRLDEIARQIVVDMQPSARKRRIRLVEQPAQRLPPVAADKSLISQAVKNLVSNAIKYSPEKTTVTVSTTLEAESVRVSVEDRGYGIPAEARDRVWEKFYRVVREGQEKDDESTGLGLSFVREVVEQHGGRVELETEEGRGSRFSFTLPRF